MKIYQQIAINQAFGVNGLGGDTGPSYLVIANGRYWKPRKPTSTMECRTGFENCSFGWVISSPWQHELVLKTSDMFWFVDAPARMTIFPAHLVEIHQDQSTNPTWTYAHPTICF